MWLIAVLVYASSNIISAAATQYAAQLYIHIMIDNDAVSGDHTDRRRLANGGQNTTPSINIQTILPHQNRTHSVSRALSIHVVGRRAIV